MTDTSFHFRTDAWVLSSRMYKKENGLELAVHMQF
jgi:hypothetical protein